MNQELSRKELQSLCKQHGIPANRSNQFMAQSLAALASPQLATSSAIVPTPAPPRWSRGSNVKSRKEVEKLDTSLAKLILSKNANSTSSASSRTIRKCKLDTGLRSGSLLQSAKELPTETTGQKLHRVNQVEEVGTVEDRAESFVRSVVEPITTCVHTEAAKDTAEDRAESPVRSVVEPITVKIEEAAGVSGAPDERSLSFGSIAEALPALRVKVEGAGASGAGEDRLASVGSVDAGGTTEHINIEGASTCEEQVFAASLSYKEPQLDWMRLTRIAQNIELILAKTTNIVDKYKSWRQEALLE